MRGRRRVQSRTRPRPRAHSSETEPACRAAGTGALPRTHQTAVRRRTAWPLRPPRSSSTRNQHAVPRAKSALHEHIRAGARFLHVIYGRVDNSRAIPRDSRPSGPDALRVPSCQPPISNLALGLEPAVRQTLYRAVRVSHTTTGPSMAGAQGGANGRHGLLACALTPQSKAATLRHIATSRNGNRFTNENPFAMVFSSSRMAWPGAALFGPLLLQYATIPQTAAARHSRNNSLSVSVRGFCSSPFHRLRVRPNGSWFAVPGFSQTGCFPLCCGPCPHRHSF